MTILKTIAEQNSQNIVELARLLVHPKAESTTRNIYAEQLKHAIDAYLSSSAKAEFVNDFKPVIHTHIEEPAFILNGQEFKLNRQINDVLKRQIGELETAKASKGLTNDKLYW